MATEGHLQEAFEVSSFICLAPGLEKLKLLEAATAEASRPFLYVFLSPSSPGIAGLLTGQLEVPRANVPRERGTAVWAHQASEVTDHHKGPPRVKGRPHGTVDVLKLPQNTFSRVI